MAVTLTLHQSWAFLAAVMAMLTSLCQAYVFSHRPRTLQHACPFNALQVMSRLLHCCRESRPASSCSQHPSAMRMADSRSGDSHSSQDTPRCAAALSSPVHEGQSAGSVLCCTAARQQMKAGGREDVSSVLCSGVAYAQLVSAQLFDTALVAANLRIVQSASGC